MFPPPQARGQLEEYGMCGLCGALGVDDHWSRGAAGAQLHTPAAERNRQAAAANTVLRFHGFVLKVWNDRYMLYGPTGRSAVVDHVGLLWAAVEKLAGIGIDPLDETVIARMEGD